MFTAEGSNTEANFLNVTLHKDSQGHIQTAFYTPKGLTLIKYLHNSSFLLNLRSKVYQTARPYEYVEWIIQLKRHQPTPIRYPFPASS